MLVMQLRLHYNLSCMFIHIKANIYRYFKDKFKGLYIYFNNSTL